MCGISVIIQKSSGEWDGKSAIEKMVADLNHRGPDGYGFHFLDWDEEKIWIGHNLLAITEIRENARQPWLSADGQCGIVFNGEIFNHHTLRKELADLGHTFTTQSDTETLLAWLGRFGRKGLRKLIGMYAFVYWDSRKRFLLIHRDSYGIKPLYYARNRNFLVCASEAQAICKTGLFQLPIDPTALAYFLRYKFVPQNASPWHGLKQVLPGEAIEYWESKPMHFQVAREPVDSPFHTLAQAMDAAFSEIIPRNQKVGLMLSGGIDSAILLKWCLEHSMSMVVFSIRFTFDTPLVEDQNAVEYLQTKFGFDVEWVDVRLEELSDPAEIDWKEGLLVADSAFLLTRRIAAKAREKGVRILLSGAGADEWFAGYRRHWFYHQWNSYKNFFPELLRKNLVRIVLSGKGISPQLSLESSDAEVWEAAVASKLGEVTRTKPVIPLPISANPLESALRWDQQHYLVQDVLTITDAATMAFGIEGRFPFLHPSLTQFADSLSPETRLKSGRKVLLKNHLMPWAGKKFVHRKKQGFGLPTGQLFLSETGKKELEALFETLSQPFPQFWATEQWEKFKSDSRQSPASHGQELFTLWVMAQWLKHQ